MYFRNYLACLILFFYLSGIVFRTLCLLNSKFWKHSWHGTKETKGISVSNSIIYTMIYPNPHMHKYEGETVCQNYCIELLTQTLLLAHISMVTRLINLRFILLYAHIQRRQDLWLLHY